VHGVPGGETVVQLDDGNIRYMTVREVARVMTFLDSWRLAGPRGEQMRQLGNAVPVRLGPMPLSLTRKLGLAGRAAANPGLVRVARAGDCGDLSGGMGAWVPG
jgi:C-5 cytosine-specific DNA methylase